MPLSQVPPTCGYSMHKNSLALVMLVPYDGCNMVQEVTLTEMQDVATPEWWERVHNWWLILAIKKKKYLSIIHSCG